LGGGKLMYSRQWMKTEVRNVTDILGFVNNFRLKEPPPPCFGELIVSIFRISGRWAAWTWDNEQCPN
jgi:hypothetical protein